MFDFSWSELIVIGAVALVVIGPKDLPKALKTAGMVVRRARGLAREFQNSIDDMIREAELEDLHKTMRETANLDLNKTIRKAIDPEDELRKPLIDQPPPREPLPASALSALPRAAQPEPPAETAPEPEPALAGPQPPPAP
jgi:sec-independent protein translocase protein TatB